MLKALQMASSYVHKINEGRIRGMVEKVDK